MCKYHDFESNEVDENWKYWMKYIWFISTSTELNVEICKISVNSHSVNLNIPTKQVMFGKFNLVISYGPFVILISCQLSVNNKY